MKCAVEAGHPCDPWYLAGGRLTDAGAGRSPGTSRTLDIVAASVRLTVHELRDFEDAVALHRLLRLPTRLAPSFASVDD